MNAPAPLQNLATTADATDSGTQYLSFRLGNELYAVDILRIQEIRGLSPITPIPNVPVHVRGVINLRGAIVPIIDLRIRFGIPNPEYHRFTVIIVATVGTHTLGLVVDAVSDVLSIAPGSKAPTPDFGERVDTSFITGLFQSQEQLVLLLDLDTLLADDAHGCSDALSTQKD